MNTLLYVRNLPLDVTAKQVAALFSQAGEVLNVYLIADRWTAAPKSFGFVQMESEKGAQAAVKLLHESQWLNHILLVLFTMSSENMVSHLKPDYKVHSQG